VTLSRGRKRRLVIPRGSLADGQGPFDSLQSLRAAGHGGRFPAALLFALGLHAALGGAASRQHEAPPQPGPAVHPQIQATLQAPAVKPPAAEPPRPRIPAARTEHLSRAPPAPAQAGRVIAQARADNSPADLTGFDLVVGQGTTYAGGLSSAKGTSSKAVEGQSAKIGGVSNGAAQDLSRPAGLLRRDWSGCPWPDAAQDSDLREAAVTVRVTVGKDGSLQSVETLNVPPGGFAESTRVCLSREPFRPALDQNGAAIPDTHLLVVHFVR
jgi:hypothetical protein